MASEDTMYGTPRPAEDMFADVMAEGLEALTPLMQQPQDPCAFVIFGASGDLTGRKLIPALYNLSCQDLLPPGFAIVGFAITPLDDDDFRSQMRQWVKDSPEVLAFRPKLWDDFAPRLHYVTGDFEHAEGYQKLNERLTEVDREHGCGGNRLFYLATAPPFYTTIVANLDQEGLAAASGQPRWARIVVEKPFGRDLASARELNHRIHEVFKEEQVYRIDHYLGKETVQNILAFRFANSIIEPIWNHQYIDHVQITAAETMGAEHRGAYYDRSGCLRDMFQNHLFQLMSLVAMEPPVRYTGQSVRDRKADVLKAIVPINPEHLGLSAVRGQYRTGKIEGVAVPGYRAEPDIAPDSRTETFAALKLQIDNWRWANVPFYLRSGKRLERKLTLIAIEFKKVPHLFFPRQQRGQLEPNVLLIRIQPDEGIALKLGAKMPGSKMFVRQMQMEFSYGASFGEFPATAYETLLLDVMEGDPTLFNRSDAVELAWEILEPIIETWQATRNTGFPNYEAGSWGPEAATALLARDGRAWKNTATLPRFHLAGDAATG